LIDIPTSIAVAQGNIGAFLRSTAPLKEPFPMTHEPKSKKAKEKLASQASTPLHDEYRVAVETALSQIRSHVSALPWCLPRKLMLEAPMRNKSDMDIDDAEMDLDARLREWSANKGDEEEPFDFERMMASISDPNATLDQEVPHAWMMSYKPIHEVGDERQEPWESSFYNSNDHAVELAIFRTRTAGTADAGSRCCFRIPPRASLFLSDSTHSDAFRASFRELTEEYVLPRHFDFILLDPPWPSGSAKRKGNYEQVGGMPYMRKLLSSMDIDNYVEHNGLVGIWITNKESLREHVLGLGGLFEQWNVGLIEEWIWIKTTIKGEPMLSLDSEWRKPYEVLLLGRAAPNAWTTMQHAPSIKRRVIAAVPDVHSRKPCLKELIEPLMPDEKYNALEIFSRYLVSGWTSWGNEVLKFNWDHYWDSGANGALTPLERLEI
jgi:N6-adenosine-specific RNA methylase IME4